MSSNRMSSSAAPVMDPSLQGSLEHFIKFPSPNFKDEHHPESDFVFVYNETSVPIVVVLLGWAGCQDRYLMKYSKIYEDRGLITVRYTAPVENLFWKRAAMKPIGEKILKLIYDMNFDRHPVIFHVFSNGGAFLYQHIFESMQHAKKPVQVRGMIFDSAPGDRRFLGLYRAIWAIYDRGNRKKFSSFISLLIAIGLSIIWFLDETFQWLQKFFFGVEFIQKNPMLYLMNEGSSWPQLFLYSKEDLLIPYHDIENFAEHRRKRGVPVSTVLFNGSEHVKHYIKYKNMYIQCVCKFINDCMASYPSSSSRSDNFIKYE